MQAGSLCCSGVRRSERAGFVGWRAGGLRCGGLAQEAGVSSARDGVALEHATSKRGDLALVQQQQQHMQ